MPHSAPTCLTPGCPRRLLRLALLLLAWLGLSGALAAPGAQTLRIGVYENLPKVGLDAGGRAQGFFVEVIEAIARAEGWRLEYVRLLQARGS